MKYEMIDVYLKFCNNTKTSVKLCKENALTADDGVPTIQLLIIEGILNQTRFFDKCDKMIEYGKKFYTKIVLTPKIMNFPLFE